MQMSKQGIPNLLNGIVDILHTIASYLKDTQADWTIKHSPDSDPLSSHQNKTVQSDQTSLQKPFIRNSVSIVLYAIVA